MRRTLILCNLRTFFFPKTTLSSQTKESLIKERLISTPRHSDLKQLAKLQQQLSSFSKCFNESRQVSVSTSTVLLQKRIQRKERIKAEVVLRPSPHKQRSQEIMSASSTQTLQPPSFLPWTIQWKTLPRKVGQKFIGQRNDLQRRMLRWFQSHWWTIYTKSLHLHSSYLRLFLKQALKMFSQKVNQFSVRIIERLWRKLGFSPLRTHTHSWISIITGRRRLIQVGRSGTKRIITAQNLCKY